MVEEKKLIGKRILVVDDHEFMRSAISMILNDFGFAWVLSAENGKAAVKLLNEFKVDLVITDIQMEPINGLELLKMIRTSQTEVPNSTPVIVMSGHSERDVVGTALKLDVNAFSVKPVRADDILEKIDRCFSKKGQVVIEENYHKINTDFNNEPGKGFDQKAAHVPKHAVGGTGTMLSMSMLRSGMVLAKPLLNSAKNELLPEGTKLSESMVLRLKDIGSLYGDKQIEVHMSESAYNKTL